MRLSSMSISSDRSRKGPPVGGAGTLLNRPNTLDSLEKGYAHPSFFFMEDCDLGLNNYSESKLVLLSNIKLRARSG